MSKKDETLKLALSTLANARDWVGNDPEGRWDEDEMYDELCNMVKFVSEALADSALEHMAENARELGLDYEPPCKTGSQCTSKCQQCEQPAQQQEPVGRWIGDCIEWTENPYKFRKGQPLYTSPPAQRKPWVGLTDAEIDELDRKNYGFPQPVAWRGPFARAVEAKLKERNA